MSDSIDIRRALEKRLSEITDIPSIAYENVPFEPTAGANWIRAVVAPFNRVNASIGTSSQKRHQGFFRVEVFIPDNKAAFDAEELADIIIEEFEIGDVITENGKNIRIRGARSR